MNRLIPILIICLISFGLNKPITAQTKSISVNIVKQKGFQELWVKNSGAGNATVSIVYSELNNAYSEPEEPTTVVGPGESKQIASIFPSITADAWNYKYNYFWRMGSPDAYPDGTVYLLPYESQTSYNIMQGYNGTFSHYGDQAYATDFEMPVGTPVLAARGGTVVEVVQQNDGAGTMESYRNKANFIRIEHSDGTVAEYTHIRQFGANVSEGDIVETGAMIGYSGNVGFSSGPHLHFHVCRPLNGKEMETFPVLFKTLNSGGEELVKGVTYTAP